MGRVDLGDAIFEMALWEDRESALPRVVAEFGDAGR